MGLFFTTFTDQKNNPNFLANNKFVEKWIQYEEETLRAELGVGLVHQPWSKRIFF